MNPRVRVRGAVCTVVVTAVAGALAVAGAPPVRAATTNPNPTTLELRNAALSRHAATAGMVLLENRDGALPMARSGNVALFGVGAYGTPVNGVGSGMVNSRYAVTVRQGFENAGYHVTTSAAYWDAMTEAYRTKLQSPMISRFGPTVVYSSVEQQLTPESVKPTAPTDTAVFVIARAAGENGDRSAGPSDFQLTGTEVSDLRLIGQTYRHVVVLIASNGVIDTSFFKQVNASVKDPRGHTALDAMLYMSQAGQEAGNALLDVLTGVATPSAKLTDTWASKYAYYPASKTFANNDGVTAVEDYTEGIYVGYRYFDSFYKTIDRANPAGVVAYPFGYGLSYTRFAMKVQSVTADMSRVRVRAKVTNVGKRYSGQQVVETYFSAPQRGVDKPYQELAGYAKTGTLAPGASQVVTISFNTTDMASYATRRAAWVMDAGTYLIRVGDSSRSTRVAARLTLGHTTVTEQVSHELTDQAPAHELTSNPADFYTYRGERAQIAAAPRIALSTVGFTAPQSASPYQQNVTVDSSSPYYRLDGSTISSVRTYLDPAQTNWEGTGKPYALKTGEVAVPVTPRPGTTLYDVAKGKATLQQFVAGLSVDQLADIVEGSNVGGSMPTPAGAAGFTTPKYENLGIPSMTLSDGTSGLRLTQRVPTNPVTYQFATDWPIATMMAQSWDPGLVQRVGNAIADEMRDFGVTVLLAPGLNIHRDPLNGRNFEYYSEDPLLTGLTSAALTEGVQAHPGLGVTIKHFAANNQETARRTNNSVVSERALREIELKSFEVAVKQGHPMAVMTAYNQLQGTFAAQNYDLDTDVLRGEWGFQGLVMSDWLGSHDAVATMYAGNDLIMPGGNPAEITTAIKRVPPTIDVAGLPAFNKVVTSPGPTASTTYTWQFGGFVPSATGTQHITTTVNASTDLSRTPLSGTTTIDAINNQTFTPEPRYTSVNDAYTRTTALLAGAALTPAQKSGIRITDVQHSDPANPSSPVVSYTVVLSGDYASGGFILRLGDLQRSAMRVLATLMRSAAFAYLANRQGVPGIRPDATPPVVHARSGGGRLTLTATDALTSVRSIEYSRDGGATWHTYRGPVRVRAAQRVVTYRATDAAGNVSTPGTIVVHG